MAHHHDRHRHRLQLSFGNRRIIMRRQPGDPLHSTLRSKMVRHDLGGLFRAQDAGMKDRRNLRLASRGDPGHLFDLL